MKAKIYVENGLAENGFDEKRISSGLRNAHVFDGYYADIIEITDVKLHGVKDLDNFIKMLECARPCFQSGNGNRNYFK